MSTLRNIRAGRREKARQSAWAAGIKMLGQLRDDQAEHVRHLLRSWCGTFYGGGMTETNIHMPICRRAIRRTLRDRP